MSRTGPVTLYGPLSRTLISTSGSSAILALRHDLLEAVDRLGGLLAQLADVPPGEGDEQHRRRRGHRRVALGPFEHAHLADDVTGTELGDGLVAVVDLGAALLDRDQVVGVIALAHELLALGHRHLGRQLRDRLEGVVVEVREHADALQPCCVHLSSRSPSVDGEQYRYSAGGASAGASSSEAFGSSSSTCSSSGGPRVAGPLAGSGLIPVSLTSAWSPSPSPPAPSPR